MRVRFGRAGPGRLRFAEPGGGCQNDAGPIQQWRRHGDFGPNHRVANGAVAGVAPTRLAPAKRGKSGVVKE